LLFGSSCWSYFDESGTRILQLERDREAKKSERMSPKEKFNSVQTWIPIATDGTCVHFFEYLASVALVNFVDLLLVA
jgi:hypothetical protein